MNENTDRLQLAALGRLPVAESVQPWPNLDSVARELAHLRQQLDRLESCLGRIESMLAEWARRNAEPGL